MTTRMKRPNMISFLGPFVGPVVIFGTWAILGFVESCVPQWSDPSIHCEHSVQFYSLFACGVLVLAGLVGWAVQIIYHPMLPFPTSTSELPSALRFDIVVGMVSYGLIRWEIYPPNSTGQFSHWAGISLLFLGVSLILVNHFSRRNRES